LAKAKFIYIYIKKLKLFLCACMNSGRAQTPHSRTRISYKKEWLKILSPPSNNLFNTSYNYLHKITYPLKSTEK